MDPKHPAYDATLAAQNGSAIRDTYEQMDQVLGEVLPTVDRGYDPAGGLRPWICALLPLIQSEYMAVEQRIYQAERRRKSRFQRTIRQRGLEPDACLRARAERALLQLAWPRRANGIVEPGGDADELMRRFGINCWRCETRKANLPVITRVDLASEAYQGPYARVRAGYARRLQPWISGGMENDSGRLSLPKNSKTIPIPGAAITAWITRWFPECCSATGRSRQTRRALTDIAPTILGGVWNRQGKRYDWTIGVTEHYP